MGKYKTAQRGDLHPHPLNETIYGKPKVGDEQLRKLSHSITEHGILTPLIITEDNVVISGHTRLAIAHNLNINRVPVVVVSESNPLKIAEMVIHSNRQREKTPEQKAREVRELTRIERERAKARQAHGKTAPGKTLVENLPQAMEDDGKARDKAAAAVGWSGKTGEKAVAVVDAIDEAEAAGDTERANTLRAALNKSVNAGAKAIAPEPEQDPDPGPDAISDTEDEPGESAFDAAFDPEEGDVNTLELRRINAHFDALNPATQRAHAAHVIAHIETLG